MIIKKVKLKPRRVALKAIGHSSATGIGNFCVSASSSHMLISFKLCWQHKVITTNTKNKAKRNEIDDKNQIFVNYFF